MRWKGIGAQFGLILGGSGTVGNWCVLGGGAWGDSGLGRRFPSPHFYNTPLRKKSLAIAPAIDFLPSNGQKYAAKITSVKRALAANR